MIPKQEISVRKIEQLVSQYTDQEISLKPGTYQTEELKSIDEFWQVSDRYGSPRKPA